MPRGASLEGLSNPQERFLSEGPAQKLEADGQPRPRLGPGGLRGGEAARQAEAAEAREIAGNRENVREIHLEWVIGLLAHFEGRRGGHGSDDGVNRIEGLEEVAANERADLLGSQIISIVVTAAQNISAQDNAPLDLGPETGAPRPAVKLARVRPVHPRAVADAVEAGEIMLASAVAMM